MPTEFFCSRCSTVVLRSWRSLGRGDLLRAEDVEFADDRLGGTPQHGQVVKCPECGDTEGFMARGDALPEPTPVFVP